MDVLIFDNQRDRLREAEIILAESKDLPLKKKGWQFNWRSAFRGNNSMFYILKLKRVAGSIEGMLELSIIEGRMVMNLIEIAPHNQGGKKKRFEYVAGCLIAFACFESFQLKSNYKGFLSFETKTKLESWYQDKYYAEKAMGNLMFIWPKDGKKLIAEYLERKS